MIARLWHGRIRSADAKEYLRYIERTGLRDYRACPGNRGALMLVRPISDEAEVYTLSLWDSYDDIKAFAGEDIAKARYYPQDQRFLLEFEERVQHFDVIGELDALSLLPD
jgi:heme-degrading monooxygenase HmoA